MPITIIDHQLPYDTHNTYGVDFFGDLIYTTVTHDSTIVTEWISEVESIHRRRLHHLIVGLDVEWPPSFNSFRNLVATLQLCVGRRCLVFQFIHSPPGAPLSLTRFLSNPNYTFVGVGIKSDLEKLGEDYGLGYGATAVDLRDLAAGAYGRRDLKHSGLKELAGIVLEKEVEKPKWVTMSRWDNERLSYDQVHYACVDAFVCFEIGRILNASG